MNPLAQADDVVAYVIGAIISLRAAAKLVVVWRTDMPRLLRLSVTATHGLSIITVLLAAAYGLSGVALLVAVVVLSAGGHSAFRRLWLVRDFAVPIDQLTAHYQKNWHLTTRALNERGLEQLSWFTRDPELKAFKKEAIRIAESGAGRLARPSVLLSLLGVLGDWVVTFRYEMPSSGDAPVLLLLLLWRSAAQVGLALVLALVAYPIVIPAMVELRMDFAHRFPGHDDLL